MITLKKGREGPLFRRHPWVFSGAVERAEKFEEGEILPIQTFDGKHLGFGFYQSKSSLAIRMINFDRKEPLKVIEERLISAFRKREALFDSETTAYRLINSEGDGLSGLVIDRYNDYLVLQIGTMGFERIKEWLIEKLLSLFPFKGIYEKSDSSSRRAEGMGSEVGVLWGDIPDNIEMREEGYRFNVSIKEGQKTGFFLDQREMRKKVLSLSKDRAVLNGFSYTGGAAVYAMKGGARFVDSVDISKNAIQKAYENCLLNQIDLNKSHFIASDLFNYLEETEKSYDLIILDPPAFAKREKDFEAAFSAYRELNALALKKLNPSGILLTSSCSYYMDEESFTRAIQEAAIKSKQELCKIGHHILALDHPYSIFHPEGSYLKSLIMMRL